MAASHRLNFDADGPRGLRLDIAPLIALAMKPVSDAIGVHIPSPATLEVQTGPEWFGTAADWAKRGAAAWPWLTAGAVVAALLSLLAARRRSTAVLWLGLGITLVGGAYWLLASSGVARTALPAGGPADGSAVARAFLDGLLARSEDSFSRWALLLAAAGVVLAIVGVVGRVLTGRRG